MSKPQSTKYGAGHSSMSDLQSLIHFCAGTGQIWLHENRMLLVHADAQAALREELIETLGVERAKGLLTRMGYASGVRDVEIIRRHTPSANNLENFAKGPVFHTLEGIVKSTPVTLNYDPVSSKFYAEDLWENSWEGQWHKSHFGPASEPVCWTLIGYASGYSSAFFGRRILYKEVECVGMGHNTCRVIGKPVEEWEDANEYSRLFERVSIAEQLIDLQTQVVELRSAMTAKEKLPADIVGDSKVFRAAYALLKQAAEDSHVTVLLQGETGVGKEVFARSLHSMGARRNEPFIAINCAAIPQELVESELFGVEKGAYTGALASRPGRFERANHGTLFLDEIGELPLSAQAKLLRVLQEGEIERLGDHRTRKIDVRLVAANNVDLRSLVKEGKFRSDLFYRLNTFQINIPPLRDRKEDILPLAERFMEKYSAVRGKKLRGYTDKAKRALLAYPWPGNVRELQNMIERGVILAPNGTRIEVDQIFSLYSDEQAMELGLESDGTLGTDDTEQWKGLCDAIMNGVITLDRIKEMVVVAAVEKARGNLSKAARSLDLTRSQVAYCMEQLQQNHASRPPNRNPAQ